MKRFNHKLVPVLQVYTDVYHYGPPQEFHINKLPECTYNRIGFVTEWEVLHEVRHSTDRIMCTHPAVVEGSNLEKFKSYGGFPRFSFGIYWLVEWLLLIEDIDLWAHNYIEFDQIRNVYDLHIEKTRKQIEVR